MATYGLEPPLPEDAIREAVLEDRPRFEEKLRSGLAGLDGDRLVEVRYEDLVARPMETIATIYDRLKLGGFETARPALEADLQARAPFTASTQQPASEWRERLDRSWAGLIARHNRVT